MEGKTGYEGFDQRDIARLNEQQTLLTSSNAKQKIAIVILSVLFIASLVIGLWPSRQQGAKLIIQNEKQLVEILEWHAEAINNTLIRIAVSTNINAKKEYQELIEDGLTGDELETAYKEYQKEVLSDIIKKHDKLYKDGRFKLN